MTAKIVWFVIFFVVGIIVMKCVEPNEKSGNHISKIGVEIVIGILGTIAASILEPLWTPDDKTIEIIDSAPVKVENEDEKKQTAEIENEENKQKPQGDVNVIFETETEEKTMVVITGAQVKGTLTTEEQVDVYTYSAPTDGKYRFDFETGNVNQNFKFLLEDETGQVYADISSESPGVTVTLEAGEEYEIKISGCDSKVEDYRIAIGEPREPADILANVIQGELCYENQEDVYYYKAPVSGRYRFDFEVSNVNNEFMFYVYDEQERELTGIGSGNQGKTLDMEEGETYKVKVVEHEGTLEWYKIEIGVPNVPIDIVENSINGSIQFTGQKDIYYYVAPRTGRYRFDFDLSNVNHNFSFYMYDSKEAEMAVTHSGVGGKTVDLNQGEKYRIEISESEGVLEKYAVVINVPNEPQTVSQMPVNGNILYKDQIDRYYFTVPDTGKYRFQLSNGMADVYFWFAAYDSKEAEIVGISSIGDNSREVELQAGEQYRFEVRQSEGMGFSYEINLGFVE